MKNFTNNFKQFTSRLSARWLIMALMLLMGTGSAWGWTVYYDNTETQWSNVYVVLGHDSYHRGDYKMTKVSDSENLYYLTKDDWGDAKYVTFSNTIVAQNGSDKGFKTAITSGYYSFNNGASSLNHLLFKKNGTNLTIIEGLYPRLIFNCNHIGFYVGEYQNWNNQQFYVHTKNSDHISSISPFKDGTTSYYGVVYATSKKYNITHTMSWDGPALTISTTLGYAYLVTGDNTIDASKKSTALSCNFSIDNTIKAGETTTVLSNSTSGKSYFANNANQKYEVDSYYVKKSGETSLTKLEVEGSELQTQSLAVGEYTIYVLLFDGRIYAKGGEQTLTIETACEKPDAPDFGTNGVEVCEGTQVTLPTIAGVTLKWYDENNQETTETFNATENKTYYAVVVGDCESDKTPYAITIKTKPTVTLNPTENTVCSGVALEGITRYVEIESTEGSQISWYAAAQGGDALASSTALDATSYFAEATLNGCSSDRAKFTITGVLSAPTEVPNVTAPESICDGESAVLKLNNKNANYTYKVNGEVVAFTNDEYTVSPTSPTTDYIVSAGNKCGSLPTTKTITVNPLPTINIGEDVTAVKFEDVMLTATGNNIADVTWSANNGTITEDATDPTKAVLTYDQAGTVEVTATATSTVGCTSTATKTVKFSEENCETGRTKIYFRKSYTTKEYYHFNINDGVYLYAWNSYTNAKYTGEYPGTEIEKTEEINGTEYYVYEFTEAQSTENLKIIVRATYDYCSNNYCEIGKTRDIALDVPGATYTLELANGDTNKVKQAETEHKKGDSNTNYDVYLFDVNKNSTGGGITITAPAVKTVSVTSDEDGNVTMVGQVVKTGCDTQAILGLQYKKQNPDGTTYEANYTTYPNPGTKEAISAGKTFTVTTKLEDGTYLVRARIDNSHATNGYGEDIKVVVNTTKTAISNVTLDYCNEDGEDIDDPKSMCKGATAYVRLDYTGSKYSDIKWLVEGVETNLVTDEGDGVWSYEIQGNGSLSVELKNDANTDPAWPYSNKLPFTIIPEPTAPYISIDPASGVICQGSSATIKVENPSTACSYKLVEEDSKADFTPYKSGDLTYTVQKVGKYYVVAQHNACTDNEYTSNQVAINQIISTNANISIDPEEAVTTPWEPVTITVKPDAGYIYELSYTDNNLAGVNGVRIKRNGDSYTYYIPRPEDWTTGDSDPVRTPINYGIEAQLKVDGEESTCKLKAATAIIQFKDEDNEDCSK